MDATFKNPSLPTLDGFPYIAVIQNM